MEKWPHYWDKLDPEVRALLEEVRASRSPEYRRLMEDEEYRAQWCAAALADLREFLNEEFGFRSFTEQEGAEAQATVESLLDVRPAPPEHHSA